MRRASVLWRIVGGLAVASGARVAAAEAPRDPAAAEALFNDAVKAMKDGDTTAACAKFQASVELDPAVATHLQLAKCHEREGKLAKALYAYQSARKLNGLRPDPRRAQLEEFARRGLEALEPRVPRLRIDVVSPPPGTSVRRDGHELPLEVLGATVPADPGEVVIEITAPGHRAERRVVAIAEGKLVEVSITLTSDAPPSPLPAVVPVAAPPAAPSPAAAPPPPAPRGGGQRIAGLAIGGVGVLGLGAAAVLGGVTLFKVSASKGTSPDLCDPFGACGAKGIELISQAATLQTGAFAALGVGLGLVGVGAVVLATAPKPAAKPADAAVVLRVSPAGASVRGSF